MAWTFSSRQSLSSALLTVEDDEELPVGSDEEDETEASSLFPALSVEGEDPAEEEMVLV